MSRTEPGRRDEAAIALALFVAGLTVLGLVQLGVGEDQLLHDAAHYLELARSIDSGEGFTCRTRWALNIPRENFPFADTYRAPLYPLMIAGLARLTGDLFTASKWISVLSGAFLPPLTFLFARRRLGLEPRFAVLAGALTIVHHHLVISGTRGLTETPFTLAAVVTIHLVTADRPRAAWAGVAVGLAWLTRYQGTLLVIPALLAFAWPRVGLRNWVRRAAAFVACALVVASPWLVRNQIVAGSPTYSDLRYHLLSDYDPQGSTFQYFHGLDPAPEPLAWIVAHPAETTRHFVRSLEVLARAAPSENFGNPLLAVLALLGMIALAVGRGVDDPVRARRHVVLIVLYGAANVFVVAVGFADDRHLTSLDPFLVAFSAAGVMALWPRPTAIGGLARRLLLVGAIGAVFALEARAVHASIFGATRGSFAQVAVTRDFLGAHLADGEPIMAEKPYLFAYALDRPSVSLPWSSDDDLLEVARHYGVRFICVGDWSRRQPHADSFLAPGAEQPPWLLRVFVHDDPKVEVFEVLGPPSETGR